MTAARAAPSARMTVVVADHVVTRRLVRSALGAMAHVVDCKDGFEAVEAAERLRPDLLVVGRRLPGLDGIEVTSILRRAKTPVRFVPIVLVSAETSQRTVLAALAAGVHDFVAQPFSLGTLRARVVRTRRSPRPFITTPAFFGPIPPAQRVMQELVGRELHPDAMICGARLAPIDLQRCPLGTACHCQGYVKPASDAEVVEL